MALHGRIRWGLLMPGKYSRITRQYACDRPHLRTKKRQRKRAAAFLCFGVFQVLDHWRMLVICPGVAGEGDQQKYHVYRRNNRHHCIG